MENTEELIEELIIALQDVPKGGSWTVISGPYGHGHIVVYDENGMQHSVISNKKS